MFLCLSGCVRYADPIPLIDRESEWSEITKAEITGTGIAEGDEVILGKTYLYTGYYWGVPVVDFIIDLREKQGVYYARSLTYTRGLLFVITRLKSDAAAFFRYDDESGNYRPIRYHMNYSVRGKEREITLKYARDGRLESELVKPALTKVTIEQKHKDYSFDPFTAAIEARRQLMDKEKGSVSLPLYSGRTRIDMHVRKDGKKLHATYTPVAGYSEQDLKEFQESNMTTSLQLDPLTHMVKEGLASTNKGKAKFKLTAVCETLEACIEQR